MDKDYLETQYRLAFLDYKIAKDEKARADALKEMSRIEQIASQKYGFEYADSLHVLKY